MIWWFILGVTARGSLEAGGKPIRRAAIDAMLAAPDRATTSLADILQRPAQIEQALLDRREDVSLLQTGATTTLEEALRARGDVSLLQTGEGTQTLDQSMSCKQDCAQDKRLVKLTEDCKQSDKDLEAAKDRHALYDAMLLDMQGSYLKHLDTVALWREESGEMWASIRKKLKLIIDANMKKEDVALQRVKEVLESTFGAVASMFQYEVAKMGEAKHALTVSKKSVLEQDIAYTNLFDSYTNVYEKELITTTDKLYKKQEDMSKLYDEWNGGATRNLEYSMKVKDKKADEMEEYLNKVMFLGGATKEGDPSLLPPGVLAYDATSLMELQHKAGSRFFNKIGNAFKDFGNMIGNAFKNLGCVLSSGFKKSGCKGKAPPTPPAPVVLPSLKSIEEATRNSVENMEDKTSIATTNILADESKLERNAMVRDKKFQAKMSEMERNAQEESGRQLASVENAWGIILNEHGKQLMKLEMLVELKIGQITGMSMENYREGAAIVKDTKKELLSDLKGIGRIVKQTQRKVENFVSSSKEQAGALRVDIAKEGVSMDVAADTAKQEAKKRESAIQSEIIMKFNGFNQELDSATTFDIAEATQGKNSIDQMIDTTAVEGKTRLSDLKEMTKVFNVKHKQMFEESLAYQEKQNQVLVDLGKSVLDFSKECRKSINKNVYSVEDVRSQNADGLAKQLNTLSVLSTKALQDIHAADLNTKDAQNNILEEAKEALRRQRENDMISMRSAQSEADRSMTQASGAIERSGRRHVKNVGTAKDQMKQLEDQIPTAQSTVDRAKSDVREMSDDAKREYDSIKKGFEARIANKFSSGSRLLSAQIKVDSESAKRDLEKARSEYGSTSGDLSKELGGLVVGMDRTVEGIAKEQKQATEKVNTVQAQEKATTARIEGAYTMLTNSLVKDDGEHIAQNNAIDDWITNEGSQIQQVAEKQLAGATAAEEAAFDTDLNDMGKKISHLSKETDVTFGEKQRLIQQNDATLSQEDKALSTQEAQSKTDMAAVEIAEEKARKAAQIAAAHAQEAMSEDAQAARAAEAETEQQRQERVTKLQQQVRSQGHFASEKLQQAISTVGEDAQAEVQAIRDMEHLTEREKAAKIRIVEMAAEDVIQEMAATEAAKGEGLTAFELMATKWGNDLGAHIEDLEDALQFEESQRAGSLAQNKADLADMSSRFHTSVTDVKNAVEQAVKMGKIVLTPEEMQELHEMQAKAHSNVQMRRADAEKELRIAELSKSRAARSAEMSEEELAKLSQDLALLTGTVSGGVSKLRAREDEASRARDAALKAQEHFSAAGVGEGLDAVSHMAEFLLAATRVSGLKERALKRQAQKFSEALQSPLANIQADLGMKTSKVAKNEADMEGMVGEAKSWDVEFKKRRAEAEQNGRSALVDGEKALESMPQRMALDISRVEAATSKSMKGAMASIENEAGFDAKKAQEEMSRAGVGNGEFAKELEDRAKHAMSEADAEMWHVKHEELQRLERLDSNDDQLADEVMKLEAKAVAMRTTAQKLQGEVSAAVAAKLASTEAKRRSMGQKLGDMNAKVHAMAGVAQIEVDSKGQSLLQASDSELERLAEELEHHTAEEAKKTAEAEQLNKEVHTLIAT